MTKTRAKRGGYTGSTDAADVPPPSKPLARPGPTAEDLAGAVTVAYVHSQQVAYSFMHSLVQLVGYDFVNEGRVVRGGFVSIRCGTDGLTEARNTAVEMFLKDQTADWMFWVDTDMGFDADAIDRLLVAADPVERPIVGALCFLQKETEADGMGGWRCVAAPTIFDWTKVDEQQGFAIRWDYPDNTVVRSAATGAACILIHRSVFERIEAEYGRVWYDRFPNTTTGQLIGEDMAFCMRAGALKIPVHVHTGVKTTHQKTVWLAEDDYFRHRTFDDHPSKTNSAPGGTP